LILIFEIVDLKMDDPHFKTVPQQIGFHRQESRSGSDGFICTIKFYPMILG
jgi:hypothetical protein